MSGAGASGERARPQEVQRRAKDDLQELGARCQGAEAEVATLTCAATPRQTRHPSYRLVTGV